MNHRLLPRFRAHQEAAATARRQRETGQEPQPTEWRILSALGDEIQLRGIPAIGRGVTGAIRGSIPGALIDDRRS